MKLMIQAQSNIGCVRNRNEDRIGVGQDCLKEGAWRYDIDVEENGRGFLVCVADGMGGHQGGEYASEMVIKGMIEAIEEIPRELPPDQLHPLLRDQINHLHGRLLQEGASDPEKLGMGSTFIGALFFQGRTYMLNVGDSRMYRFRGELLAQLSRDHSLNEMMQDPTTSKNVIINSFGAGKRIFFDLEDLTERLRDEDKLVLCSDGLTGELEDEEIEALLSNCDDPAIVVEAAMQKGGRDNISIVVIAFV